MAGGMHSRRACLVGTCVAGACVAKGVCKAGGVRGRGGVHGRRDGHCSGQYASYWNAFLFTKVFFLSRQTVVVIAAICTFQEECCRLAVAR